MVDRPVDVTKPPEGASEAVRRFRVRAQVDGCSERVARRLPIPPGERLVAARNQVDGGVGAHHRMMTQAPIGCQTALDCTMAVIRVFAFPRVLSHHGSHGRKEVVQLA